MKKIFQELWETTICMIVALLFVYCLLCIEAFIK